MGYSPSPPGASPAGPSTHSADSTLFFTTWAKAASATSRRIPVSEHQSRKDNLMPWGTHGMPKHRSRSDIVDSLRVRSHGSRKTKPTPSPRALAWFNTARAPSARAPTWSDLWNHPDRSIQVKLRPQRQTHLAAPTRRQDQHLRR